MHAGPHAGTRARGSPKSRGPAADRDVISQSLLPALQSQKTAHGRPTPPQRVRGMLLPVLTVAAAALTARTIPAAAQTDAMPPPATVPVPPERKAEPAPAAQAVPPQPAATTPQPTTTEPA